MRILLLNDLGIAGGGAEAMTFNIRRELRRRGHDARLMASTARPDGLRSGMRNEADYTCFGTTSSLRNLNRALNFGAHLRLRDVLRSFKPDLVHVRMMFTQLSPLILPLLRRLPSLYHAAWHEAICPTGHKLLPDGSICRDRPGVICRTNGCLSYQAWMALMVQHELWERWRGAFDAVVANSEALRARLIEHGIDPVEVVPNGVEISDPRSPLSAPPTAAYAGRLSHEKGVDVLVDAFAQTTKDVPDARLIIAGDGPQREALQAQVKELGVERAVEFTGHLEQDDLGQKLRQAWALVVPSRLEEPFGIATAEAMMRGSAVVASDAGGLASVVVDGKTGLLAARGRADALAVSLTKILNDRDLAESMGAAARERALAEYTISKCVDRFLQLYERLGE